MYTARLNRFQLLLYTCTQIWQCQRQRGSQRCGHPSPCCLDVEASPTSVITATSVGLSGHVDYSIADPQPETQGGHNSGSGRYSKRVLDFSEPHAFVVQLLDLLTCGQMPWQADTSFSHLVVVEPSRMQHPAALGQGHNWLGGCRRPRPVRDGWMACKHLIDSQDRTAPINSPPAEANAPPCVWLQTLACLPFAERREIDRDIPQKSQDW